MEAGFDISSSTELEDAPLVCSDGCGVLGPVLEDWFKKAYHGTKLMYHINRVHNIFSRQL